MIVYMIDLDQPVNEGRDGLQKGDGNKPQVSCQRDAVIHIYTQLQNYRETYIKAGENAEALPTTVTRRAAPESFILRRK